jgi:hypothetical protein
MMITILETAEKCGAAFGGADLAERLDSGNADMVIVILEGGFERFDGALVARLAERDSGGLALGRGDVFEGLDEELDGFLAVSGGFLMLAESDGAEDKFGVSVGTPTERGEGVGDMKTNVMVGVTERVEERIDGTLVAELTEGLNDCGADIGLWVIEGGGERSEAALIAKRAEGLGGGDADFGVFVFLQCFSDGLQDGGFARSGHFLDHTDAGLGILGL